MRTQRHALLDAATGQLVSIIIVDQDQGFTPPTGLVTRPELPTDVLPTPPDLPDPVVEFADRLVKRGALTRKGVASSSTWPLT